MGIILIFMISSIFIKYRTKLSHGISKEQFLLIFSIVSLLIVTIITFILSIIFDEISNRLFYLLFLDSFFFWLSLIIFILYWSKWKKSKGKKFYIIVFLLIMFFVLFIMLTIFWITNILYIDFLWTGNKPYLHYM